MVAPEDASISRGLRPLRSLCVIVLLLFTLAIAVQSAAAQAVSGTLLGTVTDNTGGVLPGATVTITHIETGRVRMSSRPMKTENSRRRRSRPAPIR